MRLQRGGIDREADGAPLPSRRFNLTDLLASLDGVRTDGEPPERAGELWLELTARTWSIVDHLERGDCRYFLASRNDSKPRVAQALSARERQVLYYAARGDANKVIAHTLGLSTSSVSTLLTRAARKFDHSATFEALRALSCAAGDEPPGSDRVRGAGSSSRG